MGKPEIFELEKIGEASFGGVVRAKWYRCEVHLAQDHMYVNEDRIPTAEPNIKMVKYSDYKRAIQGLKIVHESGIGLTGWVQVDELLKDLGEMP